MELYELKNLGATSINWLKAAGISTEQELQQVGPIEAYVRVKDLGIKVSKVFLYALYGALHNIEWQELSDAQKQLLVKAAKERLEETAMA